MSGPNPPGPESEELEPGVEPSHSGGESDGGDSDFRAGAGDSDAEGQTGQTDVYSRAYSAPESEHISSGPYVPANLDLYDYDTYDDTADAGRDHRHYDAACASAAVQRGAATAPAAVQRGAATTPTAVQRGAATGPSAGSGAATPPPRAATRAARTGASAGTRRAQAVHVFGDR